LYVITCVPDDWAGGVVGLGAAVAGALAVAEAEAEGVGALVGAGLDEQPARPAAMTATAKAARRLLFT
jgi:hypothetical protein